MARFIDAELFEQDIKMRYCNNCENPNPNRYNAYEIKCRCCHIDDMLGEIEDAPSADVVEVKHGKWIVPSGGIKIFEDRYVICSECNVMIPVVKELDRYWYCPNCGAKMDGKDTNVPTK